MSTICPRLKYLRTSHDLTQKQMSQSLNINLRTYQSYEHGDYLPPIEQIETIAQFFNVNPAWLLGWENTTKQKPSIQTTPHYDVKQFDQLILNKRQQIINQLIQKRYTLYDALNQDNFINQIHRLIQIQTIHQHFIQIINATEPDTYKIREQIERKTHRNPVEWLNTKTISALFHAIDQENVITANQTKTDNPYNAILKNLR